MRFGLTLLVATSACEQPQDSNATLASLAEAGDVSFNVSVWTGNLIGVRLIVEPFEPSQYTYPNCVLLDDTFGGTIGGLEAFPSPGGNFEDQQECNEILLTVFDDEPLLNQTVELHDRSLSISGTFAVTALAPRYAIHPTWEFSPSSNATFTWSHPPDITNSGKVVVEFVTSTEGAFDQVVVPTNDEIPIVVPSILPGQVEVVFGLGDYEPVPALECINATRCTASFFPLEYRRMAIVK